MRQHDLVAVRQAPPARHPFRSTAHFHATVTRKKDGALVSRVKLLVAIAVGFMVAGVVYHAVIQP